MSRKYFEAAAAIIRAMYQTADAQDRDIGMNVGGDMRQRAQGAEDVFVAVAQDANPRFDAFRFRQACRP